MKRLAGEVRKLSTIVRLTGPTSPGVGLFVEQARQGGTSGQAAPPWLSAALTAIQVVSGDSVTRPEAAVGQCPCRARYALAQASTCPTLRRGFLR